MSDGTKVELQNVAENIAWEENERELAVRLNLTLRDVETADGGRLAAKLALCTEVYLFAEWDDSEHEVFRGTIWQWEHSQMHGDQIIVTCYDRLYYLQKSQDNRFFAKKTTTKTVIKKLLESAKYTLGEYTAPDVKHGKLLYKGKTLAVMLTDTLKDADEKVDEKAGTPNKTKSFIRATKDVVDVIIRGGNEVVYGLYAGQNIISSNDRFSMTELVTRVMITGKEDKNKKPKVSATVNGKTEYGIIQVLHSRGDTTLKEAKKAAQKILDEKGKPKRTTTIKAAEFPGIRKGDKVYAETDEMVGYFYVVGISHNATNAEMQMEVEPEDE